MKQVKTALRDKSNVSDGILPDVPVHSPNFLEKQTTAVAIRPDQLQTKRLLTLDVTSISRLQQVICQTLGELTVQMMPGFDAARTPHETYTVDIMDVTTGESYCLICNAVLASTLKRAGAPLAGRYFAIRAGEVVAGKRYRKVDVAELERTE